MQLASMSLPAEAHPPVKKPTPLPQVTIRPEQIREATIIDRSLLYRWLHQNCELFSATVSEAGRPNWRALAQMFGEAGLTDAKGQPPTAETARQTWWRVRRAVQKRGKPSRPSASAQPISTPQSPKPREED